MNKIQLTKQVWYHGVLFLLMAVLLLSVPVSDLLAEDIEAGYRTNDIQQPPEFDSSEIDINKISKKKFFVRSYVNAIYEGRIIVGDIEVFIDDSISLTNIHVGDYVGVIRHKSGKITGIYRLQKELFD